MQVIVVVPSGTASDVLKIIEEAGVSALKVDACSGCYCLVHLLVLFGN